MTDKEREHLALLSMLLQYPESNEYQVSQFRSIVSEFRDSPVQQKIVQFLDYLEGKEWGELAEKYVATFDFSEHSNLYLTSLLYPEDRKRGQILANLKNMYSQAGFEAASEELPDYLPMLLEFFSVASEAQCKELFEIAGPGIEELWKQLAEKHSPYAGLLEACFLSTRSITCPQAVHTGGGVS